MARETAIRILTTERDSLVQKKTELEEIIISVNNEILGINDAIKLLSNKCKTIATKRMTATDKIIDILVDISPKQLTSPEVTQELNEQGYVIKNSSVSSILNTLFKKSRLTRTTEKYGRKRKFFIKVEETKRISTSGWNKPNTGLGNVVLDVMKKVSPDNAITATNLWSQLKSDFPKLRVKDVSRELSRAKGKKILGGKKQGSETVYYSKVGTEIVENNEK
jgi:predicted transcriptional regulator